MRRYIHETTTALPPETRVEFVIEIWGPLAFLWDRIVARKLAAGAKTHAERFLSFAETLS